MFYQFFSPPPTRARDPKVVYNELSYPPHPITSLYRPHSCDLLRSSCYDNVPSAHEENWQCDGYHSLQSLFCVGSFYFGGGSGGLQSDHKFLLLFAYTSVMATLLSNLAQNQDVGVPVAD